MRRKATDAELGAFGVEHLGDAPIGLRAALCRRLADLIPDPNTRTALYAQAETLDEVAADHQQLLLNLRGGPR